MYELSMSWKGGKGVTSVLVIWYSSESISFSYFASGLSCNILKKYLHIFSIYPAIVGIYFFFFFFMTCCNLSIAIGRIWIIFWLFLPWIKKKKYICSFSSFRTFPLVLLVKAWSSKPWMREKQVTISLSLKGKRGGEEEGRMMLQHPKVLGPQLRLLLLWTPRIKLGTNCTCETLSRNFTVHWSLIFHKLWCIFLYDGQILVLSSWSNFCYIIQLRRKKKSKQKTITPCCLFSHKL